MIPALVFSAAIAKYLSIRLDKKIERWRKEHALNHPEVLDLTNLYSGEPNGVKP